MEIGQIRATRRNSPTILGSSCFGAIENPRTTCTAGAIRASRVCSYIFTETVFGFIGYLVAQWVLNTELLISPNPSRAYSQPTGDEMAEQAGLRRMEIRAGLQRHRGAPSADIARKQRTRFSVGSAARSHSRTCGKLLLGGITKLPKSELGLGHQSAILKRPDRSGFLLCQRKAASLARH